MATYSARNDLTTGITYMEVEGSIQPDDFVAFAQSDGWNNRTDKVCCDLTRATFNEISNKRLIGLVREIKPFTRAGVRVAYIVRKGLEYGLTNMFKVYAEQLRYPVTMEIFIDKELALSWLLDE